MSKDKENTKKKRNNISENPAMSHRGSKTIRIFMRHLMENSWMI